MGATNAGTVKGSEVPAVVTADMCPMDGCKKTIGAGAEVPAAVAVICSAVDVSEAPPLFLAAAPLDFMNSSNQFMSSSIVECLSAVVWGEESAIRVQGKKPKSGIQDTRGIYTLPHTANTVALGFLAIAIERYLHATMFAPLLLLFTAAYSFRLGRPLVCANNPRLQLVAGASNVSATHENPFGHRCRALLYPSDPGYPPMTFSFAPAAPCNQEILSFSVPLGMPSGETTIFWECDEQLPTCVVAVISNGQNLTEPPRENGTVTCVDFGFDATTTLYRSSPSPMTAQSATSTGSATIPPGAAITAPGTTSSPSSTSTSAQTIESSANPPPTPTTLTSTASRSMSSTGGAIAIITITHTVTSLLTTTVLG
ncbi:hypothetical protein GQ53DRAFT_186183 [Thozetella sp. PMI_491]|nr:hypothetical protein GQ53DRAFT_186183 [Thozetella sp. PMI_491]